MNWKYENGSVVINSKISFGVLHDLYEAMCYGEEIQEKLNDEYHVQLPDKIAIEIGEEIGRKCRKVKDFGADSTDFAKDEVLGQAYDSITDWLDNHPEGDLFFKDLRIAANLDEADAAWEISSNFYELLEIIYKCEKVRKTFEEHFLNNDVSIC